MALGRTRGRLAAVPHGDDGAGLRVLGGGVLRSGAGDLGLEVGGELEGLGGQGTSGGGRGRGAGRLRAREGGARTRRRAKSHREELLFFMMSCRWREAASLDSEPGCCFLGINTIPTIRSFCMHSLTADFI